MTQLAVAAAAAAVQEWEIELDREVDQLAARRLALKQTHLQILTLVRVHRSCGSCCHTPRGGCVEAVLRVVGVRRRRRWSARLRCWMWCQRRWSH
jgi:hypothetical protein